MTTPIQPMSAEESIEDIVLLWRLEEIGSPRISTQRLQEKLRLALASHLAYVMEKMKPYEKEHIGVQGDTTIFAVNTAVQSCLAVLQSEINELTK